MTGNPSRVTRARLILLPALMAACLGLLLSSFVEHPVEAFSGGPPPGYTGAPNEEPEACAECHVPADAGTGQLSITAPQTYVPNQTYQITVTHTNSDPTRLRWGFQLTALDESDQSAGNLANSSSFTQVLDDAGQLHRQYIEHSSLGTFQNQQFTANWIFNWTAPSTDIGTVTFYAAGNQANNDGNTSGDYVYKTFVATAPFSATPDFDVSVTPAVRAFIPGGITTYTVTITPSAGFTGSINLSATGLPPGASHVLNPSSVNITDANAKTSVLTISTTGATPIGDYQITVTGMSGSLTHSKQVTLKVINPSSLDLAVSKTVSPNPGQVGVNLAYRITVVNNGPAAATNAVVTDNLPSGVNFVSATSTQGSCNGTSTINCTLGNLAVGASAVVTITVTPTAEGSLVNTASAQSSEVDYDSTNNSSSINTLIQPTPTSPVLLDSNLTVSTVVSGLDQPISLAFINAHDFLVLEKATGRVRRLLRDPLSNIVTSTTILDLPVNSASERGLLGIALHPQFAANGYVYLFWSESNTGADTASVDSIDLLGNRVDRYILSNGVLTFDRNLIRLRALQQDAGQPSRGNHNGGVLRFGPDGKLYVLFGDVGRRGFMQNLATGGPVPDDQFGGPEPDDAHMSGVILRLNDDGSTPSDNPFFNASTGLGAEAAANIKKIFGYGVRNGFGMAFDPIAGFLWTQENGDDAFDEMNRVSAGFNGGWIQAMGPVSSVGEYKGIESTYGQGNLQQLRWPPSNIANDPQTALSRLYVLPGSHYAEPKFSWKYAVAPAAIGFVKGRGLGSDYEGDLLVGASRTTLLNGYLFRFEFSSDRKHFQFTDSVLDDLVADNADKFDLDESESLLVGRDFGVITDIQTSPSGSVFVVSLLDGRIYEIKAKPGTIFHANLTASQEVPPTNSTATGTATLVLSPDETKGTVSLNFSGLSSAQTDAHIHGPAAVGVNGPVLFGLPDGQFSDFEINLTPQQVQDLKNGLLYVNVHSLNFSSGEIRGQFQTSTTSNTVQFSVSQIGVGEGEGSITLNVTRSGNIAAAADVNFATQDTAGAASCDQINSGAASSRCDYQTSTGTIHFAAGQSLATISIPIIDDSYDEGVSETFSVVLSNPAGNGLFLSSPSNAVVSINDNDNDTVNGSNPIDQTTFFVRQHYLDFLNREPDSLGLAFWTNEIIVCGNDPVCIEVKRINVSAAFFVSIEFQETGFLVYRMYKAAYGNLPGAPVPVRLEEFLPDTQQIGEGVIVGQGNWQALLEANKVAFAQAFVTRQRFTDAYPITMTPAQFVDALYANAGVTPSSSERDSIIGEFGGAPNTSDVAARARVVRRVAENATLVQQELNRAFVLMQYFGYLRRNPYDAPEPTLDFAGYNFWLAKLNQFNGNYIAAEMVKAFISSFEYRQRFGP